MTDQTNTAAGDLSLPGGRPAPDVPQMSVSEATSRKNEFMADKAKVDALMAGDADATATWRSIVNAISAQPLTPTDPREEAAEALQQSAGFQLSEEVLQEIRENRPVSPLERHFAQSKFDEFKNDPAWIQALNRGSMKERKELALIQSILSRPVRDPQSQ
jgi:hypothetical protein